MRQIQEIVTEFERSGGKGFALHEKEGKPKLMSASDWLTSTLTSDRTTIMEELVAAIWRKVARNNAAGEHNDYSDGYNTALDTAIALIKETLTEKV